ncbi:hypothetical protein GCM10020229_74500 [Kitasatospora albolonga]
MLLAGTGAACATALTWMALARITEAERAAPTVSVRFMCGFLPKFNRVCAVAPRSGAPGLAACGAERVLTCCSVRSRGTAGCGGAAVPYGAGEKHD